jgi:hypothetical protein
MEKNGKANGPGTSADVPAGVPEPDQIASGTAATGQKNNTYPGIHGDLALYLYDHQDRVSDRLNKKIERLNRRLAALEERGRFP